MNPYSLKLLNYLTLSRCHFPFRGDERGNRRKEGAGLCGFRRSGHSPVPTRAKLRERGAPTKRAWGNITVRAKRRFNSAYAHIQESLILSAPFLNSSAMIRATLPVGFLVSFIDGFPPITVLNILVSRISCGATWVMLSCVSLHSGFLFPPQGH